MSRPTLNGILRTYQNPDNDNYVSHLGQNVLSKERDLLKQLWPNELNDIRWARDTARDTANARYPDGNMPKDIKGPSAAGWNNTDGHRDAFRHALWGALTAREMDRHRPDGRGTTWAENFLYAHEGRANNNKTQEAMDLYNNNVGFRIYRENPKASPEQLANLVEKAVKNGEMVVINKQGNLNWSDKVPLYQHGSAEHPVRSNKRAMADGEVQLASADIGAPVARTASVASDLGPKGEQMFDHLRGKIEALGVASDNQKLDKLALDLTVQSIDKKLTGTPDVTPVGTTLWAVGTGPDGNRAKIDMDITNQKDVGTIQQEGRQVIAARTEEAAIQPIAQTLKAPGMVA
jgi:hypothetical protein